MSKEWWDGPLLLLVLCSLVITFIIGSHVEYNRALVVIDKWEAEVARIQAECRK
jgi:hypothetical protein